MKHVLNTCLICLAAFSAFAQEKILPPELKYRNSINSYIGLIELNFNYERNLLQHTHYYTNMRAGFGYWTNLQLEGTCIEAVAVHVLGRKDSHPEFNLGVKYIIDKAGEDNAAVPLVYAGYRFEQPEGRIVFRFGLTFPSIFNLGLGWKF